MNKDILEGNWKQMKGKIQSKWGDLTDDELDQIAGRKEEFVGVMQEKYGKGRDEAEREFEQLKSTNE